MPPDIRTDFLRPKDFHLISAVEHEKNVDLTIHRSVIFLVMSLIFIELFGDILYLALRTPPLFFISLSDSTRISLLPLYLLSFVIISFFKLILFTTVSLSWANTYYEIGNGEVKVISGIFSKKEKAYSFAHAQEVRFNQGFFGNIFNVGTLEIFSPALKQRITISGISHPRKCAEIIKSQITPDKIAYQA